MQTKQFKLQADQLKKLVISTGWCLATDKIMVDGLPIGYMQRVQPRGTGDSGWRFFAGDEDEKYMANVANHGVYDLNTVVNYDTDVIPYLSTQPGSRFDKLPNGKYLLLD